MSQQYSPASSSITVQPSRAKLLVVDDEPINIQAVHQIFAAEHDVFMATRGEQALAFCSATPPDLILLDVVMPGMDGLEVCRRLREHPSTRNIPVIFITGYAGSEEENDCWDAGGVDFVSKPVNPTTLRNRVRAQLTLKFQADRLREMAMIDGLTGVANRRYFDERLEAEWRRCARSGGPLALLLLDVDYFKRFNDHYGHLSGDDCLRRIALTVKACLHRPFDLVARYGGEEFACILPETNLEGARRTAQAIESAVRAEKIEHARSTIGNVVTVSIGIGCVQPSRDGAIADLLASADARLYRAKESGRGQVYAGD